jgi:hypothetical protein
MDIQNKNTKMFHLYQEDIFNCEQTRDIQRKSKIQGGFQIRNFKPHLSFLSEKLFEMC